jgi:sensor histidine kinase YesM
MLSVSYGKYVDRDKFSFALTLGTCTIFLIPQILASYFLAYFVIPLFMSKKKYSIAIICFIAGSYLICALARLLIIHVAEPMVGLIPKDFETLGEVLGNVPKLLYVYFYPIFSIAFIFLIIKFIKDQNEIQKRSLVLEKEKAETELKLLKAQLNPHFLFNTLNNIYSLSLDNSPATSRSIARLSEILDYILYKCDHQFVPLSGEINLLNNYIELEKLRHDDNLSVSFHLKIDEGTNISPLLLISIVENAFKHLGAEGADNMSVNICLRSDRSGIYFRIENTFIKKIPGAAREKIGLVNLRRQLDLLYAKKYSLDIQESGSIFSVTLALNNFVQ